MKSFPRSDRVGGHIQRVLSELLQKDIKDPRLEMVTITDVELSDDLREARIYFTTSAPKNINRAMKGFKSAHGYVKRILAKHLGLRYMPNIEFLYDESFDYASYIDKLLKSTKTDNEKNCKPPEK
ncbi:MAG: 30S ribosome-binding factor RbfA [Proteobacteria bacterium]|nr:30S ribosome-binding factor RbfA [Pseudomonadota bacterium]MBU4259221.1 30S ribosome-binding factor RbfA [Pseudomonadota bacterium]MBU4286811.1 30S ribosome-binding factor RbfA [Pseudomonadota bacterium]MBU4415151.1 30S ribosome-binding factor RbfA [Pseudomonadota bacterium]MCG2757921.1 30S ribosome-binding factor RbfA [Desulfobacteraceae bacterium]